MANPNSSGWVHVVTYESKTQRFYKIGYTAQDPEKRLEEIQREERARPGNNNIEITLVGFAHSNNVGEARRAVHDAVNRIFVQRNDDHELAAGWFVEEMQHDQNETQNAILNCIRAACNSPVYKKKTVRAISWYSDPEMNIEQDELQLSRRSAEAVQQADARPTYYVYVIKMVTNDIAYTIGCTKSDPHECLQRIRGENNDLDVKLVCFMPANDTDCALDAVKNAIEGEGYRKRPTGDWYQALGPNN